MMTFSNPQMLLIGVLALPGLYMLLSRDSRFKKAVGGSKALTVILLAAALASPSITVQEQRMQQPEAVVLQDNSRSTSIMNKPNLEFDDIRTVERTIVSGNSSDLETGILQNVEEDQAYILVSDLRSSSSLNGVADKIRRRNATVNVLKPEIGQEAAVNVEGPETTYPGAENSFRVKVTSTGSVPTPDVTLNGESVELEESGENTWTFTKTFEQEGFNTIDASINSDDKFQDNNEYYKTVEVTEKPEILVLGDEGRIGQEFGEFYSFEYRDSIPEDLNDYYAVVAKEQFEESQLASYTAEGNGLVYTGDYEKRNQLLPVREIDESQQSEGAKIALAIDISVGAGKCAQETCLSEESRDQAEVKQSKKIAYSLVDTLPYNNRVGAVAYNDQAHLITEVEALSENRDKLKDRISRLDPEGPSYHHTGLRGARELLNGTGNIIMITDGEDTAPGRAVNTMQKSRDTASDLEVRLITVGVREEKNEDFLRDIAERGDGFYVDSDQSGRLNFQFAAGGTESEAERLYIVDKNHFITRSIEAEGTASAFDPVEAKRGASTLVTSDQGKPFLSTWRYGIGRVAAFSGGEEDLGAVMYRDSELVSRTLSWVVGEPQRKEDRWLNIESGQVGEQVQVEASYPIEGLNRQGEDLYTGSIDVESRGVRSFNGSLYSYNYNDEVEEVGYGEIEDFASRTGGKVFTPDQKQALADKVKSFSNEKVEKEKDLTGFFLAAALLVFLSEIGYRKRRGKK